MNIIGNSFLTSLPLDSKSRDMVIRLIAVVLAYFVYTEPMIFAIFLISIAVSALTTFVINHLFKIELSWKYSIIFALAVTFCLSYQSAAHSAALFKALETATSQIVSSGGPDGIDANAVKSFWSFIRIVVILGLATMAAAAAWGATHGNDVSNVVKSFCITFFTVLGIQVISTVILGGNTV
ncbi:MAG: hypothetical protein KME09_00210 [Pleurocapsa minor HA4230-MV1]|jgi:hypothetical protein|nr:hypothetical protein [Pleurocapsa minor HA4230-MV1]